MYTPHYTRNDILRETQIDCLGYVDKDAEAEYSA